eukprot:1405763-Prymnesium_polylepis.1
MGMPAAPWQALGAVASRRPWSRPAAPRRPSRHAPRAPPPARRAGARRTRLFGHAQAHSSVGAPNGALVCWAPTGALRPDG